jgi:hypothetical protein
MFTLLFALATPSILALEVTNTSTCTSICNGPSLTYSSDLQCTDNSYFNTAQGVLFKNCLECESTSTAVSGSGPQNNDAYWMLCAPFHPSPHRGDKLMLGNSQHEIHPPKLPLPITQQFYTKPPTVSIFLCRTVRTFVDIVVQLSGPSGAVRLLLNERQRLHQHGQGLCIMSAESRGIGGSWELYVLSPWRGRLAMTIVVHLGRRN